MPLPAQQYSLLNSSSRACLCAAGIYTHTVVDGRLVQVKVEVGEGSFDRTEILSGLKEGDVVITGLASPKQRPSDWRKHPQVKIVDRPAER